MSVLSDRLKSLRETKKTLQVDIASYMGISLRSYQRYERNDRLPTTDILFKLCKYFNVSADYLLGLSDNPEINK